MIRRHQEELDLSDEHIAACCDVLINLPIDEFRRRAEALGLRFSGPVSWDT